MNVTEILMINAACVAACVFTLWLVSLPLRDASVVDIFWGLGFVVIAWITFALSPTSSRSWLLTLLATVWGLRLSAYLAWRNHGRGEDKRYRAMRDHHGSAFPLVSLGTVFALQGAVMWVVSLPLQVGPASETPLQWWNVVGAVLWLIGFLFESIGDYQLARFKASPDPDRPVCVRGLWRYTRHPNYFGNAVIWWGLFLLAMTSASLWTIVSPILMTFLLLKVSGVALLERDLASRSAEYRDYVKRTSAFIPLPPKTLDDTRRVTSPLDVSL